MILFTDVPNVTDALPKRCAQDAMNPSPPTPLQATRRHCLRVGGAIGLGVGAMSWLPRAGAQGVSEAAALDAAVRAWCGGRAPTPGRITLDIAPLVDNGNAVPMTVTVDSPMSAGDHCTALAVFNERNPQRDVIGFTLGPALGVARVSTRVRLATSQRLVAVARMNDGSHWSASVDVVVTLAACLEG